MERPVPSCSYCPSANAHFSIQSALPRHSPASRRRQSIRPSAVLQRDNPKSAPASQSQKDNAKTASVAPDLAAQLNELFRRETIPDVMPTIAPASPADADKEVEQGYTWHFAYGANMCFQTLSRHGVKVSSRDPAVIKDPSIRIVFKHRGGHATLQSLAPGEKPKYHRGNRVHGVLYRLSQEEMKKLQRKETGYELKEVEVETYDGKTVKAWAFVSSTLGLLPQEVTPTEKYMMLLREGAKDNYLDPSYQAWLSSIETVSSAGLGSEYYETPGRFIAYSFLLVVGAIAVGFAAQHL